MSVGEAVRQIRSAGGMTQVQMAAAVGVSQASVARWESGERTPDGRGVAGLCRLAPDGGLALLEALCLEAPGGVGETADKFGYEDDDGLVLIPCLPSA